MELYCVKEKRNTPNVQGSERSENVVIKKKKKIQSKTLKSKMC